MKRKLEIYSAIIGLILGGYVYRNINAKFVSNEKHSSEYLQYASNEELPSQRIGRIPGDYETVVNNTPQTTSSSTSYNNDTVTSNNTQSDSHTNESDDFDFMSNDDINTEQN